MLHTLNSDEVPIITLSSFVNCIYISISSFYQYVQSHNKKIKPLIQEQAQQLDAKNIREDKQGTYRGGVSVGHDEEDPGLLGVTDPHFGAIDHIVIFVLLSRGL